MEGVTQMFYVKDNEVVLKEKFEALPEVVEFRRRFNYDSKDAKNIYEYVHFVYSKKSPYFYLELENRKRTVCRDRFKKEDIHVLIEQRIEVRNLIAKYKELQYTENETFLDGIRTKISEYLKLWQNNPITMNNADEIALELKVKPLELLKMKKEIEEMIFEDKRKQNLSNAGGTKLFEEPD